MDERYRAPANTAAKIENMRWDERGAWRRCHGYDQLKDTQNESASSVPVGAMVWMETDLGGRRWLIYERKESDAAGAKLVYLNMAGNTETVIQSGRYWSDAPWPGTQFQVVGEELYYVNGVDRPSRWNTLYAQEAGFSAKPAAPLILDFDEDPGIDEAVDPYSQLYDRMPTPLDGLVAGKWSAGIGEYYRAFGGRFQKGVGTDFPTTNGSVKGAPIATYAYGVTYINELGQESPMSTLVFGRAVTDDISGLRCIAIALRSPPAGVRRVRIWRTMNLTPVTYTALLTDGLSDGSGTATQVITERLLRGLPERPTMPAFEQLQEQEVYLLHELPCSGPLLISDTKSDRDLGQRYDYDATGLWPAGASLIAWFAGRMWLAGMASEPGSLRYSHHLYREQFPDINELRLPAPITALYSAGSHLYVFTARSIHLVYQDDNGEPRLQELSQTQGTNSPNCIVDVPGQGVWFVNEPGIYSLGTGAPVRVSHAVQRSWDERVTPVGLPAAWAFIDRRTKEAWFHVSADGKARPYLGFVFHYEIGQWSLRPEWPLARAVQTTDGTMTTFMAAWDTSGVSGVLVYGPGYDDWDGTAFDGVYTTSWLNIGDQRERVHVSSVEVEALGYTARPLQVSWRGDRSRTWLSPDSSVSPDHIEHYSEVKVWGSGSRQATWDTDTWKDYEPTLTRVDLFAADPLGLGITAREIQVRITSAGADSGRVGLISIGLHYGPSESGFRVLSPSSSAP